MVKGVNKSVIEISQTGSKYFSKIILYVSPLYADASAYKLSGEAEKIIKELSGLSSQPLRTKIKRMKIKKLIIGSIGLAFLIAAVLICFLFFNKC